MRRGEHLAILLSGMLSGVPRQGGASWAVLQYLLGLRRLGHDVMFVEPVENGEAAGYFEEVVTRFELEGRAALIEHPSGRTVGLERGELESFASGADLLLNISGLLEDDELIERVPVRAFLDLDPGFTQLWHEQEGIDLGFERHNRFVTIGLGIGEAGSPVPSCGRDWVTTPQPVLLERWPLARHSAPEALTTVGHWRAYGSIDHNGAFYGQKAHSLRPLFDLPTRIAVPVIVALGIHPDETVDLEELRRNGWLLVDPERAAGTPSRYEDFVRGSWAELGIAKSGYVEAGCGWFSDRSACYLASGRPVIAQDTGLAPHLPTGEGLFAFHGADEVAAAVDALRADYTHHRHAARGIAEEVFNSDRVLPRLLERL